MAENSIRDYSWLVTAIPKPSDKSPGDVPLMAGALCVHEDGLLLTVTHGIRLFNSSERIITVKAHNGSQMLAGIVYTNAGKAFGITLLQVLNTCGQKFKYIEFSDDINMSVDCGTKIVGCIHDIKYHFNLEGGLVCSSFPGNLRFPTNNIYGKFTFPSSTSLETTTIGCVTTIGSVATEDNVGSECVCISNQTKMREMVENSAFKSCVCLNESVPLIQVSGLGCTIFDGLCGCPVFTDKCNRLLGLVFLSTGYNQFIIPVPLLKEVLDEHRRKVGSG